MRTLMHDRAFRLLAAVALGAVLAAAHTGRVDALPGQCAGGYGAGNGGEFCDYDPWPDGSFAHHERVCVLGFCGNNTFRACPAPGGRIPTDNDPATPC